MKRFLSLLIAFVLVCTCVPAASAEAEKNDSVTPLVVVSGFATVPLYLHANTENAKQVFAPTAGTILRGVSRMLLPLMRFAFTKNWDRLADEADPALLGILEQVLCDQNGDSVQDVDVRKYPLSADQYPDFYTHDVRDEHGFVRSAIDTIGGENTYFFSYDWRLDPLAHADALNDFIQTVKAETGSPKIVLAACSMGGAVTMAYLSKYGAGDLKTCILDNTAFQGISVVGKLFVQDFSMDTDTMVDYLFQFVNLPDGLRNAVVRFLKRAHVSQRIMEFLQALLAQNGDRIAADVLYPSFGQMPGIWVFVADREYEAAKSAALDQSVHAQLIRKIDAYHYEIQCRAKEILDGVLQSGCNLFVLANYGKYGIPVSDARRWCNDYLIDTALQSGGAVCAPNGETLPQGYVQQVNDGYDRVSPDRRIDASTCMYPEYTWFIRDMGHLDYPYGSEGAAFLMWLVCADAQYTVHTNARYAQFMVYSKAEKTLKNQ